MPDKCGVYLWGKRKLSIVVLEIAIFCLIIHIQIRWWVFYILIFCWCLIPKLQYPTKYILLRLEKLQFNKPVEEESNVFLPEGQTNQRVFSGA